MQRNDALMRWASAATCARFDLGRARAWRVLWCAIGAATLLSACAVSSGAANTSFRVGEREDRGEIQARELTEASGIAASRINPGVFWVHNDSGDSNRVFAVGPDGRDRGRFVVQGCPARDWEDIAVGPGPNEGQSYLYIGDIGDNRASWKSIVVCRVAEPVIPTPSSLQPVVLRDVTVLRLKYPDRPHNAETLMVDALTRDLYVVTKQDRVARVYVAPYPYDEQQTTRMIFVTELPMAAIAAGDIAPDGRRILLKDLGNIWMWERAPGSTVAQALSTAPTRLRYIREPLGEGVAWSADGRGYVTVSERVFGLVPHLYFYPELP